ncbi:N-(5'-phosphoribosyl)anthranilate isomerase [Betaproteobacteria bacterium GR16-43]|nr:N-(5'-phosphoribosyl)anthranilate isomerase [Betaproteobacteria bacterium GR16-43]
MRTRIKICGLRDPAHARLAAAEGADAIGLVFHPASPRFVAVEEAARVVVELPPFVMAVGLFVDTPEAEIRAVLARVRLDLLQFHGDETPAECERYGVPYLRAVRMEEGVDLVEYAHRFSRAKALLLDAHVPGVPGGTGQRFDWGRIPRELPIPFVLSGGLDPENVSQAIRETRPWAVDVSSGVESQRGMKDPAKITAFIRSVQREDVRPA